MQKERIAFSFVVLAAIGALGLVIATVLSAQDHPAQSISGFWRGVQDDGEWAYVFEFTQEAPGRYSGVIHVYQKDHKVQEVPIDKLDYEDGKISLHVEMNDVGYQGSVDSDSFAISGEFKYADGSTLVMNLTRVDPTTLPGLSAREGLDGKPYTYEYRMPDKLKDGWETSSLTDEGLDPDLIDQLVTAVANGNFGFIHSLLIARNGHLVLEEYFYNHDREEPHRLASATKSIASLLVGIAIDQGFLDGPGQGILDFFPEYAAEAAPGWEKVTLGHILTMSAGVGWTKTDLDGFYASGDHFATVFKQPISGMPGEMFEYVSPNVDLLAGVIKQASGLYADKFAEKYLFEPLGITTYRWDYGKWQGHPLMDGSLALRPRDMAKIGQMVLDRGKWHGVQVVSSRWIEESTASHIEAGGPDDYGYLWWRASALFDGRMVKGVFASGIGSQFIFILPEYDLVVVTTGGNDDNSMHLAPLKMFPAYILPAME
jgi:CubicO group peptidase (beta-lactamase class C family)